MTALPITAPIPVGAGDEVARQYTLDEIDRQWVVSRARIQHERDAAWARAVARSVARARDALTGIVVVIDGRLLGPADRVQAATEALLAELTRAQADLRAVQGDAEYEWECARSYRDGIRACFEFDGATSLHVVSPTTAQEA